MSYPGLAPPHRMFIEDLTLYDDLSSLFDKLQALVVSIEELIADPPYAPPNMQRATALTDVAIDYLDESEWTLHDWWKARQAAPQPWRHEEVV